MVTLVVRAMSVVRRSRMWDCPASVSTSSTSCEVARRLGQPALAEARGDAALELSTVAPTWSATSWTSSPAGLVNDTPRA